MVEFLLALAGVAGAWALWRDRETRHALARRELEGRLRSRDERLRMIDADLRRVHAVAAGLLEPPFRVDMPPEDAARLEALEALCRAGGMASGRVGAWPHGCP